MDSLKVTMLNVIQQNYFMVKLFFLKPEDNTMVAYETLVISCVSHQNWHQLKFDLWPLYGQVNQAYITFQRWFNVRVVDQRSEVFQY